MKYLIQCRGSRRGQNGHGLLRGLGLRPATEFAEDPSPGALQVDHALTRLLLDVVKLLPMRLNRGLDEGPARGWLIVDMAGDWEEVFPAAH